LISQGFFSFCLELQLVEDSSLIGVHLQKNGACPKTIEKSHTNLDMKHPPQELLSSCGGFPHSFVPSSEASYLIAVYAPSV